MLIAALIGAGGGHQVAAHPAHAVAVLHAVRHVRCQGIGRCLFSALRGPLTEQDFAHCSVNRVLLGAHRLAVFQRRGLGHGGEDVRIVFLVELLHLGDDDLVGRAEKARRHALVLLGRPLVRLQGGDVCDTRDRLVAGRGGLEVSLNVVHLLAQRAQAFGDEVLEHLREPSAQHGEEVVSQLAVVGAHHLLTDLARVAHCAFAGHALEHGLKLRRFRVEAYVIGGLADIGQRLDELIEAGAQRAHRRVGKDNTVLRDERLKVIRHTIGQHIRVLVGEAIHVVLQTACQLVMEGWILQALQNCRVEILRLHVFAQ